MTTVLPLAARLAWWGTAWLRGQAVTDLAVDAVVDGDAVHLLSGLPGSDGPESLLLGLADLRRRGATAIGATFPAEGDPVGLGGPAAFNTEALDVGEAVVVAGIGAGIGLGLVPRRIGAAVTWHVLPAERRQLPDVGEADRTLRAALVQAADALADLDVARWRPEVADRLLDLRHRPPLSAPPGVPARCVELAARGLQATDIVGLALEDDGAAVSASEIGARRAALVPLERAGRHALTAACSPEVWPPG